MNLKYAWPLVPILVFLAFSVNSCKPDDPVVEEKVGHISFVFSHKVNGEPLRKDEMIYVNAAGNQYEVNQLMYFISDVTLHKSDGTKQLINDWADIHYVDIEIESTLQWDVFDKIPVGTYDSISFVFGITEEKNKSFMFVNPPEVNMMWPDILGGGYHYMMINGKWKDLSSVNQSFAFHLGIGQLYYSKVIEVDSIYAFVQNFFTVTLPNSAFVVSNAETQKVEITMDVDSWFKTPDVYDHNFWGGAIMQNQEAMQMAARNGKDVFSCMVND